MTRTPAIETIELLCQVVEILTEIIRRQASVIEQSGIDFDDSCIKELRDKAEEKLEQAL